MIELTDAASARPIPTNADEAGELVAAVDVARQGFMVLVAQLDAARAPATTEAEAAELVALVGEVARAGDRLLTASRAALEGARRHTAS